MRFLICIFLFLSVNLAAQVAQKLTDLAFEIRGTNCNFAQTTYDDTLNLALNEPRKYATQTMPQFDKIISEDREYMRFWAVKSIGNFTLFNKFQDEYPKALKELKDYYENEFKIREDEAIFFASKVAGEITHIAVGDYLISRKLSDLERILTSKSLNSQDFIARIFTSKLSQIELTNLLNIALLYGKTAVIETLINNGAALNSGDESPLFFALQDLKNVKYLLDKGADVNYANLFGKTPLFYAVEFKDYELAKLLIERGANVNQKYISRAQKDAIASGLTDLPFYQNLCALERTSRSVLMHAAMHANPQILKLLIDNGANLSDLDELGFNALDYAIFGTNDENKVFLQELNLKPKE